jgi:hypothetical protein
MVPAALAALLIISSLLASQTDARADGRIRPINYTARAAKKPQPRGQLVDLPKHDGQSTWALFRVNSKGETELLAVKPSHHPVSACRELDPVHTGPQSNHIVVTYTHPDDGEECHLPIVDPRRMYHDHDKGKGKFGGGIHKHEEAEFAVALHPYAAEVRVTDYVTGVQTAARHAVTLEHHRKFQALQTIVTLDPALVQPDTLQVVGPMATQKNIVFLSAGYTSSQKARFDDDVNTLLSFLQLPENALGVSAQPYTRYFSMTNFFKVFYPSNQEGASHPAPAGDGKSVDDNLGCSYGASSARILTCQRSKVLLLGSYAPPDAASSLYIVLVNDITFGGTGGGGICSVYRGDRMPVVFIHEVGHASASLADEYDYGTKEENRVDLENCYWSNTDPPWSSWILNGILQQPSPVCTYTNYFKPTDKACLMESDQKAMCPVCTAAVLRQNFEFGLSLAAPRYPSPYEELILVAGESNVISMNSRVPYLRDETGSFTVTWTVNGTIVGRATHEMGLVPVGSSSTTNTSAVYHYNNIGTFVVSVTIEDGTNIFHATQRRIMSSGTNASSLRQVHVYRVRVVAAEADRTTTNCTWHNVTGRVAYCSTCDDGHAADCSLTFSSRPIQFSLDVTSTLDDLQTWILGVGGVFVVLGCLVFFLIWKSMQLQSQTRVREVLPLTTSVKVIRIVLMVMQCLMLIGVTGIIFFSVYMYQLMTVFGKAIIVGIIVVSTMVWFASFLGFCASYYKNRVVLFVNFALLLMLFGLAVLFTMLLAYVLININTEGVVNQLHSEWTDAVKGDPYEVCTLQSVLQCSGFNTSCITVNTPAGTTDCPANCEIGNQVGFPCFLRIKAFVLENFLLAALGGGILSVLLFVCMILAIILGCKIKTQKVLTWKRRAERKKAGESALTPEEVAMLEVEFRKIDKDGSGDISREEFGGFYNDVMGTALTQRQLDEYFDKLDSDGSGALSFEEFVKIYKPMKRPKKRSLKEAQEARDAARTNSGIFSEHSMLIDESSPGHILLGDTMNSAPRSAQSQRSQKPVAEIDLDLALDDDIDLFADDGADLTAMAEAAAAQERQHQDQQAAVVAAQAERQKRHALEQPSTIDVENVLGDLAGDLGGNDDFGDFENMDIDLDLDDDVY